MLETEENDSSLIQQLRRVLKDGLDYLGSLLSVLQARAAELALSSAVFIALLIVGMVLGMAGFILMVVALGFWLTHLTGHVGWALLILGGLMFLFAATSFWRALAWLKQLKS